MAIFGRRFPIPRTVYTQPVYGAVIGQIVGTAGMSFAPSGSLVGEGALAGTTGASFSPAGSLVGDGALAGSCSFSFDAELGFDPTSITGCVLWLDARDASTLTSPKGLTYRWDDKSGLNNDPTFRTGRPAGIVGNPTDPTQRVLRIMEGSFTASSTNAGWLDINAIASTFEGDFTAFVVSTMPREAVGGCIFAAGNSTDADDRMFLGFTSGGSDGNYQFRMVSHDGLTNTTVNSAFVTPELAVWCIRRSGTSLTLFRNNTQLATGTYAGSNTFDTFRIGGRNSNGVDNDGTGLLIGQLIVYNTALGTTDRTTVYSSLASQVVSITGKESHPTGWLSARKQKLYTIYADYTAWNPLLHPFTSPSFFSTFEPDWIDGDVGLTEYFVNSITGNDSTGDGSSGNPYATVNKAAAQTDVDVITVSDGLHHTGWTSYTKPERSVILRCTTGRAWFENAENVPASWTKTGGFTNVYEFTLTGTVQEVYDLSNEDATSSEPQNLTLVGSIALVDSTVNSYFVTGGKVYVHTFDSRAGDRDVVVRIGTFTPTLPFSSSGRFFAMRSIGLGEITAFPSVNNMVLYLDDVRGYGSVEWSFSTNTVDLYSTNCKVIHDSDGMDYRATVTAYTEDCYYGSRGTDFAANAETGHVGACIVSLNSEYVDGSRTHHSIGASLVWLLNPIIRDSIDATGTARSHIGAALGDIDTNSPETAKMWLYWPQLSGHETDLTVANGCTITTRGIDPNLITKENVGGLGTFVYLDIPVSEILGSVTTTFTPSGTLLSAAEISGSGSLVFSGTGLLTGNGALLGSTSFVFTPFATPDQGPISVPTDGWNLTSKNRRWNLTTKNRQWTLTGRS